MIEYFVHVAGSKIEVVAGFHLTIFPLNFHTVGSTFNVSTIMLQKSEQINLNLHVFASKHKVDTYIKYLTHSNDCVTV